MILTVAQISLIKPMLFLLRQSETNELTLTMEEPHRKVTLSVAEAYINVKEELNQQPPTIEHYVKPAGLAMAYNVPLARLLPTL